MNGRWYILWEPGRVRRRRGFSIALPVGLNALLGNLMGAVNAALVPQKLVEGGMDPSQAISELGVVCGMTLPMLALPTVFLSAMSLVLMIIVLVCMSFTSSFDENEMEGVS